MSAISFALYNSETVRAIDQRLAIELGISSFQLMQRAGRAIARQIFARFATLDHFLVLCGEGNNGGDGYVIARILHEAGRRVMVWRTAVPDAQKNPVAAQACADYSESGGEVVTELAVALDACELIVDALLGIGVPRDLSWLGPIAHLVNTCHKPVVAVDLPSGLHPDTGRGDAIVRADLCVCLIAYKTGLFNGRAKDFRGELVLEALGCSTRTIGDSAPAAICQRTAAISSTRRDRNAHKGSFGHVVIVAGAKGYAGAARLCVGATLRAGAGLVSYLTDPAHVLALQIGEPEAMAADRFPDAKIKSFVLAAGPGLALESALMREHIAAVMAWPHMRVLDADALNYLAALPVLPSLGPLTVITPHPAEAARLLTCSTADIESNRSASCQKLAQRLNCVTVLKGAISIVAAPDQIPVHCDLGNPGMASGGNGDVLTGVIAALMAQGHSAFDSAVQGVVVHAHAGDRAALHGERGMLARDVLNAIRPVINGLSS
jgi:ADP-dependent NAD(P)H-hydrate dehydratase / NAD(P)H-hydrate epimerase